MRKWHLLIILRSMFFVVSFYYRNYCLRAQARWPEARASWTRRISGHLSIFHALHDCLRAVSCAAIKRPRAQHDASTLEISNYLRCSMLLDPRDFGFLVTLMFRRIGYLPGEKRRTHATALECLFGIVRPNDHGPD
jgi:hypothetical protein